MRLPIPQRDAGRARINLRRCVEQPQVLEQPDVTRLRILVEELRAAVDRVALAAERQRRRECVAANAFALLDQDDLVRAPVGFVQAVRGEQIAARQRR